MRWECESQWNVVTPELPGILHHSLRQPWVEENGAERSDSDDKVNSLSVAKLDSFTAGSLFVTKATR